MSILETRGLSRRFGDVIAADMLSGGTSTFGVALDLGILAGITVALVAIAGRLYPRLVT